MRPRPRAQLRALAPAAPAALAALASLASATAAACSRDRDAAAHSTAGAVALAPSAAPAAGAAGTTEAAAPVTVLDFTSAEAACTFGHRGVLLDLGDATMRARMSGTTVGRPDVETREHEGATWASVHERSLELSFVSHAEIRSEAGVIVEARVRGGVARSASVYLGGKPIGSLAFAKGETKIVSARASGIAIPRGASELLLRFNGGGKGTRDTLAEIDWVRVGPADGDAPYAAPTRADAIATVTIGGVARRGVSLRAPGFARCASFIPGGAVLEGHVGVTGGEADAEVRVLVDRSEPRVVGTFHLGGEGAPSWRPVSLPLGDVGTIAAVELVAKASAKGARVVFAEPRVVVPRAVEEAKPKPARGVIVVVLGTAPPRLLTPWGGGIAMPELAALAGAGATFEAHRASTSWASGALASMLTGLPAREHGVIDPEAALGPGPVTIAEAARQGGVATAMFTANPTTGAAFGFARGWETFVAKIPGPEEGTAIFDDVARWLESHKSERFLVVVHARGGHPPWDVTADELKGLPPTGYAGSLEPKHAGEMLGKAKRTRAFVDADRQRAFALHASALAAHDAALGRLVQSVHALGREGDTTWIVTGDVGVDAAAHVPFLEDDALDEGTLAVPLVVKAAAGSPPSRGRVSALTSGVDVARTALEALGLPPPPQMRGESLWTTAQRTASLERRATVAVTAARFSARWGGFVLVGAKGREGKLCNLSLEADCVSDVRPTHPLAAEALHALVYDELAAKPAPPAPRATLDAAAVTGLKEWGRYRLHAEQGAEKGEKGGSDALYTDR